MRALLERRRVSAGTRIVVDNWVRKERELAPFRAFLRKNELGAKFDLELTDITVPYKDQIAVLTIMDMGMARPGFNAGNKPPTLEM